MTRIALIFGCDLRTLALFRVFLGFLIIADLLTRAGNLAEHYTDSGVLPRSALLGELGYFQPSIHLLSGSGFLQGLLFLAAGLIALALLVGYRTRLATILSWIFLISLQNRNPMVHYGGDMLLMLLVFWGMFLPLGARFSVDAALSPHDTPPRNAYFSAATMALLIQCMSVYFFTALLKTSSEWIPDGTAVYYALEVDYVTTPVGSWLAQFSFLTYALTFFVWTIELIGPFLIFSPFFHLPLRITVMTLLILMHIGFLLCLRVGWFPLISLTSLLAFTPGVVWDRIGLWLRTREHAGLQMYYDGGCEFCRKTCLLLRTLLLLPHTPIRPAQVDPQLHELLVAHDSWVVVDHDGSIHLRWEALALVFRRSPIFWWLGYLLGARALRKLGDRVYGVIGANRDRLGALTAAYLPYRPLRVGPTVGANIVVVALMILVLYMNLATIQAVPPVSWAPARDVAITLRLQQRWRMFAPRPPIDDGWFVFRGLMSDGTPVDLRSRLITNPDFEKPVDVPASYYSHRWRKYLIRLTESRHDKHRELYGQYVCRRWNDGRPQEFRAVKVQVYFVREQTLPDYGGAGPISGTLLWEGSCPGSPERSGEPEADYEGGDL